MIIDVCAYSYCFSQSQILEALGATVERVRPVSITHRDHYVNIAKRRAMEANELASKKADSLDDKDLAYANGHVPVEVKQHLAFSTDCKGGFFADQFENLANFRAHYETTGPEIWDQTGGNLHAFVAAAGTGGTVAGISQFLKVSIPIPSFFHRLLMNKIDIDPCMFGRKGIQMSSVFLLIHLVPVCIIKL